MRSIKVLRYMTDSEVETTYSVVPMTYIDGVYRFGIPTDGIQKKNGQYMTAGSCFYLNFPIVVVCIFERKDENIEQ